MNIFPSYTLILSNLTYCGDFCCFSFAGKEKDLETGLSYLGARYSFESYKELGGVGFKNRGMDELEVFRWDKNTSFKANVYISDMDDITFSFHTHPGDRQGKGGHSGLDKKDRDCACLARQMYGAYQNYIITRHDGIQYYNEWNIIPETIYVLPKTFIGIY